MKEPKTLIGKRVRKARQNQGLSQEDLAKKAGVSLTTIRNIETADVKTTTNNLMSIWIALQDEHLFDGIENNKNVNDLFDRLGTHDHNLIKKQLKELREFDEDLKFLTEREEQALSVERPKLHSMIDTLDRYDHFKVVYDMTQFLLSYELLIHEKQEASHATDKE